MEQFDKSETAGLGLDLRAYFYLLWSWAWLIVLAAALAGATAFIMSKRMTPIYAASAQLLVNAPSTISGVDPSGGTSMYTLTTTYTEMLTDPAVLQSVIEQLKLKTTPEELAGSISVKNIANTQLLQVTAADTDPQQAADIANAMATVFVARVQDLRSQRYAAIREGLSSQISNMEQSISTTSDQIAAVEQEMAAAAAQKAAIVGTQLAVAATQTVAAMGSQAPAAATQTATAMQQQLAVDATQTAAAAPATVVPAELVQLQDRLTQYRTVYSNLVQSYEQVRMAEEQTSSNVVVSQQARINPVPIAPKTSQYTLIAALAGALLAAGVVFMVENLDDTIRNPEEVRRKFGFSILGLIARHHVPEDRPVALEEPRSVVAEAFRSLRTNITYAAIGRPLRRILVTSATPQDGKTTVACSLAVVLSQSDKRVLLIDADLRRPQVHNRFGLENRMGLTDLFVVPLNGIRGAISAINASKLAILTSGGLPPNPAELLASRLMGNILDALNRDFGLLIIDAPPLLAVTDAAALAPLVDGVILVARPGTTKLTALEQAVEQLQVVGAHLLGIVLNEVNPSSRRYGYYYSQYYSKYSDYYTPRRSGLARLLGHPRRSKKQGKVTTEAPKMMPAEPDTVATESDAATGQSAVLLEEPEAGAMEPEPVMTGMEEVVAEAEAVVPETEAMPSKVETVAAESEAVAMEADAGAAGAQAVPPQPDQRGSRTAGREKKRSKTAGEGEQLETVKTNHP